MKNFGMFCLLFTCIGLESCKDNQKEKVAPINTLISVQCYSALYEKDSIALKVNALKDGKITGTMEMKLFSMPQKIGKIAGKFRGDTLFVDYEFTEVTNDKKIFKNPMAFLKRGNELVLGNGKIETTLGRSYFTSGIPIDFDRVKFKFTPVNCVDK